MSFTVLTADVCVYQGVGGYNLIASGNIIKGQAVTFAGDNSVKVPNDSGSRLVGVANSTVYHGEPVCIWGPCNIVKCYLSGNQSAGTKVGVISEGYLSDIAIYAASEQAIVIEGTTSTGIGKVLLLS